MGQMSFFDVENPYAALDANHDPLVKINAVVPWEALRSRLENVWRKPPDKRKSNAGCKPWDAIVMFKAILLCALYNLSDDQVEYQMRDRLSFVRFLGLALEDKVPDAKTVWLYGEQLSKASLIEALFEDFDGYLKSQGYRNRPLCDWEKACNQSRSRFRARVKHVFGAQQNDMGGTLVRSIGLVRARARLGLKNLAYNMRRLVRLKRLAMVDSR